MRTVVGIGRHRMDSAPDMEARRAAVSYAKAILNEKIAFFAGCLRLADLAHALVDNWMDDPEFVLFGAIASEVDGLPIGGARQHWSAEALEREDRKLASYESAVKCQVREACLSVIARFEVRHTEEREYPD